MINWGEIGWTEFTADDWSRKYVARTITAWEEWRRYLCVEWNGDHLWRLDLDGYEDDRTIYVYCEYCRADVGDLYYDIADLICGTIHVGGLEIEIEDSRHNAEEAFECIPVNLKVHEEQYFNPLDMIYPEYDVWIVLSDRT